MRVRDQWIFTLALLALACQKQEAAPTGANVVRIVAGDFAFAAPDTIPAGLTTFVLVNLGSELHHAVVFGASGKTWEEIEGMLTEEGPVPDWLVFPGGPGVILPGDSSNATSEIAPGLYLIACYVSSPDGQMHVAKGMHRRLVVAPAQAGAAAPAEPTADVTVTLVDYAFQLSTPLTAGTHTIRVENAGPQLHEVTVEQLAPGKTLADWQAWAQGGMQGPPPTKPIGGHIGPSVGMPGWFTVTLTPGTYLLTCYVPDAADGKPHVAHGMVQEVTVN